MMELPKYVIHGVSVEFGETGRSIDIHSQVRDQTEITSPIKGSAEVHEPLGLDLVEAQDDQEKEQSSLALSSTNGSQEDDQALPKGGEQLANVKAAPVPLFGGPPMPEERIAKGTMKVDFDGEARAAHEIAKQDARHEKGTVHEPLDLDQVEARYSPKEDEPGLTRSNTNSSKESRLQPKEGEHMADVKAASVPLVGWPPAPGDAYADAQPLPPETRTVAASYELEQHERQLAQAEMFDLKKDTIVQSISEVTEAELPEMQPGPDFGKLKEATHFDEFKEKVPYLDQLKHPSTLLHRGGKHDLRSKL